MNEAQQKVLDEVCGRFACDSNPQHAKRIFHGRGGHFPGLEWLVIDALNPVLLFTCFAEPKDASLECFKKLYEDHFVKHQFTHAVVQHRYKNGAPNQFIAGEQIDFSNIQSQGINYKIRLTTQNTGFFLDMAPGREWLKEIAQNKRVLNLFAFTCAFSVVAHQAGAAKVVNVDMSKGALSLGRENHRLNPQKEGEVLYLPLNILKSWSRIKKQGPYDLVIIDPPSFQKGSFVAEVDYQKVIKRLPELCAPKADILACLNAPELNQEFLDGLFHVHCDNAVLQQRLESSPDFMDIDSNKQLKVFHYRYET